MRSLYPFEFELHLASVILAVVATILALRLIPLAGKARTWLLFSAAFVLQATDRILQVLSYSGILLEPVIYEVISDILDVVTIACLLGAAYYIREIFLERQLARHKLELHLEELQRFHKASIGRELRLQELFEENRALKAKLGEYQK